MTGPALPDATRRRIHHSSAACGTVPAERGGRVLVLAIDVAGALRSPSLEEWAAEERA